MMTLKVELWEREATALLDLAVTERRKPEAQAAIIIRHELERRGLLETGDGQMPGSGGNRDND